MYGMIFHEGIFHRTVNFTLLVWSALYQWYTSLLSPFGPVFFCVCVDWRCFVQLCSNLLFLPLPLLGALGEISWFPEHSVLRQDEVVTCSCSAVAVPCFNKPMGFPTKGNIRVRKEGTTWDEHWVLYVGKLNLNKIFLKRRDPRAACIMCITSSQLCAQAMKLSL